MTTKDNKRRLLEFAGILSEQSAEMIEGHTMKRRDAMDKERAHRRKKILEQLT